MRKITTAITERKSNGGMHRTAAYRRVTAMLDGHGYAYPRLYHLVLMDNVESHDASRFLTAIKALCKQLTDFNVSYRWRGCLERDDDKGMHFHVFILTDAAHYNPCSIINTSHGKRVPYKRDAKDKRKYRMTLRSMLEKRALKFHLSQPKADMHRVGGIATGKRLNYAYVSRDKLADCLEWVSYLVKARSKPDDIRGIYFSSRDSLRRKATPPDAEPLTSPHMPETAG